MLAEEFDHLINPLSNFALFSPYLRVISPLAFSICLLAGSRTSAYIYMRIMNAVFRDTKDNFIMAHRRSNYYEQCVALSRDISSRNRDWRLFSNATNRCRIGKLRLLSRWYTDCLMFTAGHFQKIQINITSCIYVVTFLKFKVIH